MGARMIPLPPVDAKRPIAFYDTECFPNYWLLKFRPRGGHAYAFRLYAGQAFGPEEIARMRLLFAAYCVVSFNGRRYDVPMITSAFMGYTAEQLKWQNDRIIVEKIKPWELGLPDWEPEDHIDIMEVIPGAGSQKLFAGRAHYRTMQDLPYEPSHYLTPAEIPIVDAYCENDLGQLEFLFDGVAAQVRQREHLGIKYGMDLRSKSDAQVAEAVLKRRCEQATGRKIFKQNIDWGLTFRFRVPDFIAYQAPQLQHALEMVRQSVFTINPPRSMYGGSGDDEGTKGKCVPLPAQLEGLTVTIGATTYKLGIGGLHSQEKALALRSDANYQIRMPDVASYYPTLMINSGAWPAALGPAFIREFSDIKETRLEAKELQGKLKKAGDTKSREYEDAQAENEGGKIMINGTFGKTGSPYSVEFAPEMLIQTTISGQLAILMLIEWLEAYGIPVVSANTDGIVINCPRPLIATSDWLIAEWEKRTGLTMETEDYVALYARDVNAYFAIKTVDDIKRKGEYAKASLIMKKSPDSEICSDAVAAFLADGTPLLYTISACRDITKFVTIQKVAGGAVKMWGEGPRKGARVMDMVATLEACGWTKIGRQWERNDPTRGKVLASAHDAYVACFAPQTPEYLGKVIRWYYGRNSPGPILYSTNGNLVGGSYGARPCMTLPDQFPDDIDYDWYMAKSEAILRDVGYKPLT
jgi:hypothetical protein